MIRVERSLRGIAFTAAFAMAACSSGPSGAGSSDVGLTGSGCKTGKNAPFASPAGAPFALPAGVTLKNGEVTGDFEPDCTVESDPIEYGGDLIIACMGLQNSTRADVTLTLPAGLFFLVKAPDGQNGMTLQDHQLVLPAGKTTFFKINLFCVNKHCSWGRKADRYVFGNVTSDPGLLELVARAKTHKLEFGHDDEAYAFGQAIWDITDGDGVTPEHRKLLDRLP